MNIQLNVTRRPFAPRPIPQGRYRPARYWVLRTLIVATLAALPFSAVAEEKSWVGTWMAAPQPVWEDGFALPTGIPATARNETIRQIVRVSLGGDRIRLVLSNRYGSAPLAIGAASVAVDAGSGIVEETSRKVAFGGAPFVRIPAGASAVSDPVNLAIDDLSRIAVSIFLPERTPLTTFHWDSRQTGFIGNGDSTGKMELRAPKPTTARLVLSHVLVETPNRGSVVVIGDSITDGNGATMDADTRWPDFLAARLADRRIAVLNAGISGARLLSSKMGENALARFDRDVLALPRVRAAIVLIGINDISWPGTAFAPDDTMPSSETMIAGYRQLIARAQVHGVRIVGGTLLPFEGALEGTPLNDYHDPQKDALRQRMNGWIRKSDAFDAVVDFAAALADRNAPTRLDPRYDSGDHLHPGDLGNERMAETVDLDALLRN